MSYSVIFHKHNADFYLLTIYFSIMFTFSYLPLEETLMTSASVAIPVPGEYPLYFITAEL